MVAPPDWIASLVNAVATYIHSHDVMPPLGCHFQKVLDVWEITVFASRTEIVGGPRDGLMFNSGFNVDVNGLQKLFSSVDAVSWQAQSLGSNDELGPHLSLDGMYLKKKIWLRITATAPERFGVGRRALVNREQIEEIW